MTAPPIDRSACPGRRHGTYAAYEAAGCRCPDARAARTRYRKLARAGIYPQALVPSIGSARRLQALSALGWTLRDIADRLGVKVSRAGKIRRAEQAMVTRRTHEAVRRIYAELSMSPGPSEETRRRAIRRGWAPPLAWDDERLDDPHAQPYGGSDQSVLDEVAIERVLAGRARPSTLTREEQVEVARRIVAAGAGPSRVGKVLGANAGRARRLVAQARGEEAA